MHRIKGNLGGVCVAQSQRANVVGDALSRKERVKLRRVRGKILAAQSEAFKQENVLAERLHGLDQQMERKGDESLYFMDRIWVLLVGSVMDEAHASRLQCQRLLACCNGLRYLSENEIESPWILSLNFQGQSSEYDVILGDDNSKEWNSGDDRLRLRWMTYLVVLADAAEGVRDAIGFGGSYQLSIRCAPFEALYVVIKEKLQAARDHQKSYADSGRKMTEYEILERISPVAYWLRLPKELICVHDTFHVSNLKKCLGNANLHVPLNEIEIDKTLRFVEEPVEIIDREVKSLKRSRIPLVKVRWNSKHGPEFTWEREDYMKSKYPQLFIDRAVELTS
ncbi:hypothetical protein Tco_1561310 [Tanacetum coccineum]